jgi:hypothetical protein
MPRFVTERDFLFFQHINREVVVDIVDVEVVLYKIIQDIANVNIYGESISKARYRGISLNALIKYPKAQPGSEGFGYDITQPGVEFRFVRKLLQDVNVYPEVGDIIKYNESYYEIDNINETQLVAARPEYNNNIICETHLTRKSSVNIEETHT